MLPTIFTLLGAYLALIMYNSNRVLNLTKLPLIRKLYTFLNHKYFFDIVYNYYVSTKGLLLGYTISKVLDRGIIELIGPYGLTKTMNHKSQHIAMLDTGIITTYSLYITLSLIILVFLVFSPMLVAIQDIKLIIIYISSLLVVLFP